MTDETVRRMTVNEIALMREIIAWRKAHEIEFVRRRVMGTYWVDPFGWTGPKRRCVAIELKHSPDAPMGLSAGPQHSYTWHPAESFTQAVDLLVAYGYLPARFSAAYRSALSDLHRESEPDGRIWVDRAIHNVGGYANRVHA